MRVGIIGGGYIAKLHGALVKQQPGCEIVGVADRDRTRANVLAKELGGAEAFDDAATMLKQQKPDVVHILVPPHLHAELSILGMEHGCHVFVEKPMATTMEDARRMVACARDNDVHLCPNHNQLFDAAILRCRDLVQGVALCHLRRRNRDTQAAALLSQAGTQRDRQRPQSRGPLFCRSSDY